MRTRELAFETLRRIAESPRAEPAEPATYAPVASGHVRILSERPLGMPRSRRKGSASRGRGAAPRRRRSAATHRKVAVLTPLTVTSAAGATENTGASGPKRRPGGSQEALSAAVVRALNHADGKPDDSARTDAPIRAVFTGPRRSA